MNKNTLVKWIVPAAMLGTLLAPLAAQADSDHHDHSGINARLRHQNARVEQGEANGSLTRRESNRLERRDARIHHQEFRDRMSGRRFTPQERRHLRSELNRTNHAIYHQRHDDQHRGY